MESPPPPLGGDLRRLSLNHPRSQYKQQNLRMRLHLLPRLLGIERSHQLRNREQAAIHHHQGQLRRVADVL